MRALLLALALAGCSVPAESPAPAARAPAAAEDTGIAGFVEALDRHRVARGCPALLPHEGARRVAQAHSEDMLRRRYFGHTSPEGRSPGDRLTAAGIGWRSYAENIADSPQGGKALLDLWLSSPGHRRNIETCTFTHHGVGRAGSLWTHVFLTSPQP